MRLLMPLMSLDETLGTTFVIDTLNFDKLVDGP